MFIGLVSDVCGKVGSGDGLEIVLEFWVDVGSRYVRIVCTNFKSRVNVRLVHSVYWGVLVAVDNVVCKVVYGELRMYNMYYAWISMSV